MLLLRHIPQCTAYSGCLKTSTRNLQYASGLEFGLKGRRFRLLEGYFERSSKPVLNPDPEVFPNPILRMWYILGAVLRLEMTGD